MTEEWAKDWAKAPKFMRWKNSVYHEDDFTDAVGEQVIKDNPSLEIIGEDEKKQAEWETKFNKAFTDALREAQPITKKDWEEICAYWNSLDMKGKK